MHLARLFGVFGTLVIAAAAQQPASQRPAAPPPAAAPAGVAGSGKPAPAEFPYVAAPVPVAAPRVGTYNYKAKLKNRDGDTDVQITASVEEAPEAWKILDTVVTVAGKTTIDTLLDRRTLTVRRSYMHRSGMNVIMDFKDGKVEGQYASRAGAHRIHGETQPLLAATAANGYVAGCLPLAEGYHASYSGFDSINQRQTFVELKVQGSERVTGPAGTFDTYRVEEVFSDSPQQAKENRQKTTLWVDKGTRIPVKVETVMGSEPGAMRLTSELVP